MTLFMIGIGLWDEKDITLKGLEAIKTCKYVFLENYTSKLGVPLENLEGLYGKKVILARREMVEKNSDEIINPAINDNVAFLVVGDVFGATTHTDIFLRAKEKNVNVVIINNASVLNAIGVVGLELYKFGKTTSIPFHNHNVKTPYLTIKENQMHGLHTLMLLDIWKHEEKYMTLKEAIKYLISVEDELNEGLFTRNTKCIGVARLGSPDMKIIYGKASELLETDFGEPLHSLIVPGRLHFIEEEALEHWSIK
jgi:diphthine methyl ester synthase